MLTDGRLLGSTEISWPRNGPKDYSSYLFKLVGRTGFEPVTFSVSGKIVEVLHWAGGATSIQLPAIMSLDVAG